MYMYTYIHTYIASVEGNVQNGSEHKDSDCTKRKPRDTRSKNAEDYTGLHFRNSAWFLWQLVSGVSQRSVQYSSRDLVLAKKQICQLRKAPLISPPSLLRLNAPRTDE